MSTQTNQRFVLDLLESGKIDPGEAEWLLETIHNQPVRQPDTPYSPDLGSKIILEIDADQENLQTVIGKLNQALSNGSLQDQKRPFLQRLTRRNPAKTATH